LELMKPQGLEHEKVDHQHERFIAREVFVPRIVLTILWISAVYLPFGLNIPRELACVIDGERATGIVIAHEPVVNHEFLYYVYDVRGERYEGRGPGLDPLGKQITIYYSRSNSGMSCIDNPDQRLKAYALEVLGGTVLSAILIVFIGSRGAALRSRHQQRI